MYVFHVHIVCSDTGREQMKLSSCFVLLQKRRLFHQSGSNSITETPLFEAMHTPMSFSKDVREKEVRNAAYATMAGRNLGESVAPRNRNMKERSLKKKETVNIEKGKGRTKRLTQGKMSVSNTEHGRENP